MKNCAYCNALNDDSNSFCEICGKPFAAEESTENGTAPETQQGFSSQEAASAAQSQYAQVPGAQPQYAQVPSAQPQYGQPPFGSAPYNAPYVQPGAYPPVNENALPEEYKPVSVGAYVGYTILFSIPIIGFIMLLVTALSSTNKKSLRNFARAQLILLIIGVVLSFAFMAFIIALIPAIDYGYYY